MKTEKELQLKEAYDYYFMSALESSCPLDRIDEYFAKNIMGFGTPIDENLFSIEDMLTVIIRQRQQSAGIEMNYEIKPVFHDIIADGNVAIFVDELIITMNISSNKHELFIRHTLLIEYLDSKWKVVHFHTSVPVQAESETDTWGIEEWKKKNHELEIQVKERTAELEKSLKNLKATQAQLIQSEKLASLGELTAGIAHEIQNPLNFVNNFSELSGELIDEMNEEIDNGNLEEVKVISGDLKQNLEKINHHGKRASSIIKGMLEHSRASTGVKELTDINKLADEYLRLSYHGLRAKDSNGSTLRFNSDFKTNFDENLPKIAVIPQDFGRVLLNLFNNAFYACSVGRTSSSSAKVIVSTKKLDNFIEIRVTDNGTGMSEATKTKIFQPFFTTKPTGQGTGLGLSLSYDIITKGHGGTLEVESIEGEGTTFIIKLPYI